MSLVNRCVLMLMLMLAIVASAPTLAGEPEKKIAELEAQLAALPKKKFDFNLHNQLRDLYGSVDKKKSMLHAEAILEHQILDDYLRNILSDWHKDNALAIERLSKHATEYSDLPNLSCACWLWAGDLSTDRAVRRNFYSRAWQVKGYAVGYREALEDRAHAESRGQANWPSKFTAPKGSESSPGPWNDPDDLTSWPNTTSRANSDVWLAEHHDEIRVMRPRVLVLNFSNEHNRQQLDRQVNQIIFTLAESSRYHGYKDKAAPAFLNYEIFKFVDLRDRNRRMGNSKNVPLKDPEATEGFNMKYREFFSQRFADYYAVKDPRDNRRNLRLDELLDGGYVHEVWFFLKDTASEVPKVGAFEVVEEKPRYDENFCKVDNEWVQSGNGGDAAQPWMGRSVRIAFINAGRGIGCFLESLSHGIESTSGSRSIPYFSKYFNEYADNNLSKRYGLPFDSLYAVDYAGSPIRYEGPSKAVINQGGKEHVIENYIPAGGSVHFPPNARSHYDLNNPNPVLSTIEDWRIGSGSGGKDMAKPLSNQQFRGNEQIAPDCMGAWLVYWRQNFPGLDNKQRDDNGKPMKNWWPFLFY